MRGQSADYDRWRQLDNAGWSYDDVLPYFKKAECTAPARHFHGMDGPLVSPSVPIPTAQPRQRRGGAAGQPAVQSDFNGAPARLRPVSGDAKTADAGRGIGLSASRGGANLNIVTKAQATRMPVENCRAVGVEYARGREPHCSCRARVVLAAGAINSPQLLLLSGIGPAEELRARGVSAV
jgi:choline dehydrogenase